ncbi:hypothetical protein RhiirA4_540319 [Rhizophagus irregularis]|uniref:Uncharacterized protein n=1 Tax=Rhizophagus irregularis TaxID=588596 RepID=A0A2I1G6Q1_9GLOM|nr:hypothetical protein RhiirA4_540319 [Rhizophagus irregularis]
MKDAELRRGVKKVIGVKSTLAPQLEIVNEENIGRVDYAIKALEELICITGEKLQYSWICAEFNPTQNYHNAEKVHASDGISCTNKNPLNIRFSESALKEGSGGGVKLEAGDVELLKDRVDVDQGYSKYRMLSNMTSELELLRQQVVELMAENAEI